MSKDKKTTFEKFKNLMLELRTGYPAYVFYGKFESVFAENGVKIVDILKDQGIIEILTEEEINVSNLIKKIPKKDIEKIRRSEIKLRWYRLTSKGVELAIALTIMEHSEEMRKLTIVLIIIGGLAVLVGFDTLLFQVLQILG